MIDKGFTDRIYTILTCNYVGKFEPVKQMSKIDEYIKEL